MRRWLVLVALAATLLLAACSDPKGTYVDFRYFPQDGHCEMYSYNGNGWVATPCPGARDAGR